MGIHAPTPFNGDLGLITVIDMGKATLSVSFEGRAVEYGFGELDELVLVYATTIHPERRRTSALVQAARMAAARRSDQFCHVEQ